MRGQVSGVEDRFQERLRGAMEYLQFRNVSPETKRRVLSPEYYIYIYIYI